MMPPINTVHVINCATKVLSVINTSSTSVSDIYSRTKYGLLSGIQDEGEAGSSGTAANKRRTLQDLFRPPIDLIHKGTFHSVKYPTIPSHLHAAIFGLMLFCEWVILFSTSDDYEFILSVEVTICIAYYTVLISTLEQHLLLCPVKHF